MNGFDNEKNGGQGKSVRMATEYKQKYVQNMIVCNTCIILIN